MSTVATNAQSVNPLESNPATEDQIQSVLGAQIDEHVLPVSIYDIELSSAGGKRSDILSERKGKVTLIFNVAAGCGNIPQHSIIEELNQMYKDNDDFSVLAVVVDDFVCHGYPEFQNGLNNYIEENNVEMTAGEVAEKYARDYFGVSYEFSELTNGRHDKHKYDPEYLPGEFNVQEQHPLWNYLTGAYGADLQPNGVPYHYEEVSWSNRRIDIPNDKKGFPPLRGNFEKFLIDRTGTRVKRYANGFLLGERDPSNEMFPWLLEVYTEDGKRDHRPKTHPKEGIPWPTPVQRFGINCSLDILRRDIDKYLGENA